MPVGLGLGLIDPVKCYNMVTSRQCMGRMGAVDGLHLWKNLARSFEYIMYGRTFVVVTELHLIQN